MLVKILIKVSWVTVIIHSVLTYGCFRGAMSHLSRLKLSFLAKETTFSYTSTHAMFSIMKKWRNFKDWDHSTQTIWQCSLSYSTKRFRHLRATSVKCRLTKTTQVICSSTKFCHTRSCNISAVTLYWLPSPECNCTINIVTWSPRWS